MFGNLGKTATGGVLVFLGVATLAIFLFANLDFFLLSLCVTVLVAAASYRSDVTADPPTFAQRTMGGKIVDEGALLPGVYFVLPLWGLFEDFIIIDATPQVRAEREALIFEDVRCKAEGGESPDSAHAEKRELGADVEVRVGLAFVPDPKRSAEFIRAGRAPKVMQQLTNLLGSAVREQAIDKTLEEYTFGKSALAMELIIALTGNQPTEKVLVDPKGKPILDTDNSRPHHKWKVRERKDDDELEEADIQHFLNTAFITTPPDIHGLGILLTRLNILGIEPEDEGLQEDSNRKAREKLQRSAEEMDFQTERQLAAAYVKWGDEQTPPEKITLREALEWVRTNRGRSREVFLRAPAGTAAVFGGIARDELNRPDDTGKGHHHDGSESPHPHGGGEPHH